MNINTTASNNPFLTMPQGEGGTDPPPSSDSNNREIADSIVPVQLSNDEIANKEKVPVITPNIYQKLESSSVFKTTNRIIDDIKVLLQLNNQSPSHPFSVLKSHPLSYSHALSQLKHNPYTLNVLAQTPVASKVDIRSFDNPNDEVIILRGLIFNNAESQLSKMKVHHLKIIIKSKYSHRAVHVTKNEYYLVDDDDLLESDKRDLILSEIIDESKENYTIAEECLPKLVDSATYVCSKTQKMFRIEISEPEFTSEDLNDFEIGPINVRYHQSLKKYPDLDLNSLPSPAECVNVLYKSLRGPLLQLPNADTQSIDAGNKMLNTRLNIDLLLNKLHFKQENNKFVPVNFSNYETDSNALIIKESFTRKVNECLLLGTKAYSAQRPNPFSEYKFTSDISTVFESLQDYASVRNHRDILKDVDYINISAFPFYSDELIINCYKNTVASDGDNVPKYFDSFQEITKKKATAKLNYCLNDLFRTGVLGQREIDAAYKQLLGQPDGSLADDETLISAYQSMGLQGLSDESLRSALKKIAQLRSSVKIHKFLAYELLPISKAYDALGIEAPDQITDDLVPTLYEYKKEDSRDSEELINRAFITIATYRKSPYLLDRVENEFPDLIEFMDYETACEELAVDKNHAEDIQIIEIFKNVVLSDHVEIIKARSALRVIGEKKNSDLIRQYLSTGNLNSSLIPAYDWPVGLANIGNTCYLNSILQYLFSIKPVREFVLNFDGELDNEEAYLSRTIGGSKLTLHQLQRSFQLVYYLQDLFRQMVETPERVVAPSKELAFLVFLRFEDVVDFISSESSEVKMEKVPELLHDGSNGPLTSDEEIGGDLEIIEKPEDEQDKEVEDDVVIVPSHTALEGSVSNFDLDGDVDLIQDRSVKDEGPIVNHSSDNSYMSRTNRPLMPISEFQMNSVDANSQQDAQECLSNVILQIEAVIPPNVVDEDGEQLDFFKKLFFGKTLQRLVSLTDTSDVRTKKEMFANLIVNVQTEPRTLYDGLDETFGTQKVEFLSSHRDKYERIIDIPTILQIQFQRVFYDRESFTLKKNNHGILYPQELYMDRYMDTEDPVLISKREKSEKLKQLLNIHRERLSALQKVDDYGLTLRESLIATRDWLSELEYGSETLIHELDKKINSIPDEIYNATLAIEKIQKKIDHCFDDYQELAYTLFAVFIHKGEASYGHYWIYLNDIKNGYSRRYNDENVTRSSEADVFDISSKDKTTAYFLGYVRKGYEGDIDALVRSKVDQMGDDDN